MPISEAGVLSIEPKDIPILHHFFDAFGKMETEVSARWIVEFAQVRDQGWKPLPYADLNKFYKVHFPQGNFSFQGLDIPKYLRITGEGDDRVIHFTEAFIGACYTSATRP